jgi:hypothetical protein
MDDELCEELAAVAGGRNDGWPAIRGGMLGSANGLPPMAFDGPPMPGRLGRVKMDEEPKRGLFSLKIPLHPTL